MHLSSRDIRRSWQYRFPTKHFNPLRYAQGCMLFKYAGSTIRGSFKVERVGCPWRVSTGSLLLPRDFSAYLVGNIRCTDKENAILVYSSFMTYLPWMVAEALVHPVLN